MRVASSVFFILFKFVFVQFSIEINILGFFFSDSGFMLMYFACPNLTVQERPLLRSWSRCAP
jgi:hypothetical protein